jgi:hypothetical protein
VTPLLLLLLLPPGWDAGLVQPAGCVATGVYVCWTRVQWLAAGAEHAASRSAALLGPVGPAPDSCKRCRSSALAGGARLWSLFVNLISYAGLAM